MRGNAFDYLKFFMGNGWSRTLSSGIQVDRKMGEYSIVVEMQGRTHSVMFNIEVIGTPQKFWCQVGYYESRDDPGKVADFIIRWAEAEYRRSEAAYHASVIDFVGNQ